MDNLIKSQMVYLAARALLQKLVVSESLSLETAEKVNMKNAETLMCDLLPIG
jgi:hypothetical protein